MKQIIKCGIIFFLRISLNFQQEAKLSLGQPTVLPHVKHQWSATKALWV